MQCACAVLYCLIWPVWLYHIFPHYLINGTIFFRKTLLNIKFVFWFFSTIVLKIYRSKKYSKRYCHKCILAYSNFNKTWIFTTAFGKPIGCQISWKSVQWKPGFFHADGRTDMWKLIFAFHNFANTPKNFTFCPHIVSVWSFCISEQTGLIPL